MLMCQPKQKKKKVEKKQSKEPKGASKSTSRSSGDELMIEVLSIITVGVVFA